MNRYKLGLIKIPIILGLLFISIFVLTYTFGKEFDYTSSNNTASESKINQEQLIKDKEYTENTIKEIQLLINNNQLSEPLPQSKVSRINYKEVYIQTRNKALGIKNHEQIYKDSKEVQFKSVSPNTNIKRSGIIIDPEDIHIAQPDLTPTQNSYIRKKSYEEFDDTKDVYEE